jgi:oxygen-dependent protoporphyrinogen oxidase
MAEPRSVKRVAVLGAGLTGLAAAFRLQELATARGEAIEVTLFEAGSRPGGLVGTERIGGYLVDIGADSFLTNKPGAVGLCRRLGIEGRLVATDTRFRGAFVLHQGQMVPIPEGFQLLSPTAIWPIITTPLFSTWGKLRLLAEWLIPGRYRSIARTSAKSDSADPPLEIPLVDESLSDFVLRRFGREALDRLVQPLVGGIYTSDPQRLSLAATMPRFLEMERDHGSLIRAALRQKSRPESRPSAMAGAAGATGGMGTQTERPVDTSSGARYGLFAGLKEGMQELVDRLHASVAQSCSFRLNTQVVSVTANASAAAGTLPPSVLPPSVLPPSVLPPSVPGHPTTSSTGYGTGYLLTLADGTIEPFDAVLIAVSAVQMGPLVQQLNPRLSAALQQIEYASSAIVVSGHRLADIRHPLDAFGLVIPHAEGRKILAVSFSSRKFPDRAPPDHVLLRTFIGGALQPELLQQSDEQLLQMVREELGDLLGVRGEPDFMRVYRYRQAMPQYHVGHLEQVAKIEGFSREHPGIALAGIACRGVGVPDAISSGESAAEQILADFQPLGSPGPGRLSASERNQ